MSSLKYKCIYHRVPYRCIKCISHQSPSICHLCAMCIFTEWKRLCHFLLFIHLFYIWQIVDKTLDADSLLLPLVIRIILILHFYYFICQIRNEVHLGQITYGRPFFVGFVWIMVLPKYSWQTHKAQENNETEKSP